MDMNMHPTPIDTGRKRLDIGLTALRNSGGAWWLVLGMILLQEAAVYMNGTELAHIVKRPIQDAAGKALARTGKYLLSNSWFIGPGLIAAARLLKKRDTNGCDSRLDQQGRRDLNEIGKKIVSGTTDDGKKVIEVKASELLAMAELMRNELKNTVFPQAYSDRLSPDELEKLLGEAGIESEIQWDVEMDIDCGLGEKHVVREDTVQPARKSNFQDRPKKKVRGR